MVKQGCMYTILNNNKTIAINADSIFPTASMIKIPILIGIME